MRKKIISIILSLSLPVAAQNEASELYTLSLEELLQIKITGSTLTDESRHSVPSAVTVFTHNELETMGLDYLDELANLVPGFQSYRAAGTSLQNPISSRGRRISVVGAEVLVMIDGQRADGPRSSGIAIVLPKISLRNIHRVEFIRGPGAAIYGSNAMMGVINIVTRNDLNRVSLGYGSFNRRNISFNHTVDEGDFKLDLFAQLDQDNGEHYQLPDTFSANMINTSDPRRLSELSLKMKWRESEVSLRRNQFKVEDFYELDSISNGFNQRHGDFTALSFKQNFKWLQVDSWLQFDTKETNVDLSAQLTPPGFLTDISLPASDDGLFANAVFDDYREDRLQWHNDLVINAESNLQFGFEFRHINAPEAINYNNFDLADFANGNFPVRYYGELLPTTPVQGQSHRDIKGFYAQLQHHVFDQTQLTLGLRHDNFSIIGSELSPRFGLVHKVNTAHSLKLLYGVAFRAPAESELFLQNNPVLLGNPQLQAETVNSWDLIWLGKWRENAFSLGYFNNQYNDAIVEVSGVGGIPKYENVDQSPSRGFEFEISQQWNEHWLVRSSFTYLTEKPEASYRETDKLASMSANYNNNNNWNANFIATWHGKRELAALDNQSQRISIDSHWQWNAKFGYQFNRDWQGYLQLKNISNKNDQSPALGAALTQGVQSRGREILIGFNWEY